MTRKKIRFLHGWPFRRLRVDLLPTKAVMRAHVLTRHGKTSDVVSQRAVPLGALPADPVDLKTREGEPKLLLPFSPPFALGVDLAGVVAEVGSGASSLRVGDPVFAYTGMDMRGASPSW